MVSSPTFNHVVVWVRFIWTGQGIISSLVTYILYTSFLWLIDDGSNPIKSFILFLMTINDYNHQSTSINHHLSVVSTYLPLFWCLKTYETTKSSTSFGVPIFPAGQGLIRRPAHGLDSSLRFLAPRFEAHGSMGIHWIFWWLIGIETTKMGMLMRIPSGNPSGEIPVLIEADFPAMFLVPGVHHMRWSYQMLILNRLQF